MMGLDKNDPVQKRDGARLRWTSGTALGTAVILGELLLGHAALAQSSAAPNPAAVTSQAKPLNSPAPEVNLPLSGLAQSLAAYGVTLHATYADFGEYNPSGGVQTGNTANSGYFIFGADVSLDKLLGLPGGTVHFEESLFTLRSNEKQMAGQIGDSQVGYQPAFNLGTSQLSLLTYEQHFLNDQLVVEAGRTHPDRYFAAPNCQSINSCYQDVLAIDSGFTSPQYSVWGGRATYYYTPELYAQIGAFSLSPNANALNGYDWAVERSPGALVMAEIGGHSTYAQEQYPGDYSFTAYWNSSDHADVLRTADGHSRAFFQNAAAQQVDGTQGIVLQGRQTVWRADGGAVQDLKPTAIAVYGSLGISLDSTVPVQSDAYVGVTLESPFRSRPDDHYGIKLTWERMTHAEAMFMANANAASGGDGSERGRNTGIFELNGHIQVYSAIAFEPVVQYMVNPNNYYQPFTAHHAQDGVYLGGSLIIPIGAMLGL